MSTILTFTSETLAEKRRYVFGLIRLSSAFSWSDLASWYRHREFEGHGADRVSTISIIEIFTKSKRRLWINYRDVSSVRIDDRIATKKKPEESMTLWREMTEEVASMLESRLPQEIPAWYEKRENARAPWIFAFFIAAIIIMVLVYFSPVFLIILSILKAIIG